MALTTTYVSVCYQIAVITKCIITNISNTRVLTNMVRFMSFNPSAWGHLKPSSYCDVGRFFYRAFKF